MAEHAWLFRPTRWGNRPIVERYIPYYFTELLQISKHAVCALSHINRSVESCACFSQSFCLDWHPWRHLFTLILVAPSASTAFAGVSNNEPRTNTKAVITNTLCIIPSRKAFPQIAKSKTMFAPLKAERPVFTVAVLVTGRPPARTMTSQDVDGRNKSGHDGSGVRIFIFEICSKSSLGDFKSRHATTRFIGTNSGANESFDIAVAFEYERHISLPYKDASR
jgi:hypothetical protein